MATEIVTDTALHQFHRTLVLNNKPSWSNTNQKTSLVLKTRDQTQYVYTIQTNPISQTNKPSGTPSYTKTNITQWTRIIKDNDKPNYSPGRQTTTHTQQSRIPFPHIRDIRHTITNLPHQKGSNCFFKKKKHNIREGERKGDGCTNMRPQPLRGQSRINYHRKKKRGRKGRNLAIEDRGRKNFFSTFRTSEWTRTQRIFFSSSHRIFFSLSIFGWTWRTSIQLRFFDTWRKFHSTSVDFSWVRSSSYLSSYGPGLSIPRGLWAHPSR